MGQSDRSTVLQIQAKDVRTSRFVKTLRLSPPRLITYYISHTLILYILHSPGESRRYSLDFLFAGELIKNVVNSLDESTRTSYGFTGTIEDGGGAIYTMLLGHLVGGTKASTFVSGMSYAHPASSYAQTLDNHHIDRLQPWSGNYVKSMARPAARQWAMMTSDFQGGYGIWTSVATFIDYQSF